MSATLEEDAKRKAHALYVWVVGWAGTGGSHKDTKNLGTKMKLARRCREYPNKNRDIRYSNWFGIKWEKRWEYRPKSMIIYRMDMEEKKDFLYKGKALKAEKYI